MGPTATGGASPHAQSSAQNGAPPMVQVAVAPPLLPGITVTTGLDNYNPMLTLTAQEKSGKSTIAITSLYGYPEPHHQPLVLAWDEHGPDACVRLGYHPHAIRIREAPGNSNMDKARNVLRTIETNRPAYLAQYGSIVVDCASTCVTFLHDDAKNLPKNKNNPNPQGAYWELGLYFKEFVQRVVDIGLPSIWLAWLAEGGTTTEKDAAGNKTDKTEIGGPDLMGRKVRNHMAGRAHHNFILEKRKVGLGATDPWGRPCDDEGCIRLVHSRPWAMVNAGGRYSHLLPEPCPPDFSYILGQITGRGRWGRR